MRAHSFILYDIPVVVLEENNRIKAIIGNVTRVCKDKEEAYEWLNKQVKRVRGL